MANGTSTATVLRPSQDAILRTLERIGTQEKRIASGFYRSVDEFAGLERLDRVELDETDDD